MRQWIGGVLVAAVFLFMTYLIYRDSGYQCGRFLDLFSLAGPWNCSFPQFVGFLVTSLVFYSLLIVYGCLTLIYAALAQSLLLDMLSIAATASLIIIIVNQRRGR